MSLERIIAGVINILRGEIGSFSDLIFEVHSGTMLDSVFGKETMSKVDRTGALEKYLGDTVGRTKVLTFDNYTRKTSGRWAKHELINQMTMIERTGEDTERLTLDIKLVRSLGVKPEEETAKARKYVKEGHADYLVIGGQIIGDGQWVITDLSEKLKVVDAFGRVQVSVLTLTFESYAGDNNPASLDDDLIIWG